MSAQTLVTPESLGQLVRSGLLLSLLVLAAYGTGITQMVGPFSATCALLAILPNAPFSKPKTVLVSHLLCIGIGAAMLLLPVPPLVAALFAAWIAIMAMALLKVVHAPAVAHTIILLLAKPPVVQFAEIVIGMACVFAIISYLNGRTGNVVAPAGGPKKA